MLGKAGDQLLVRETDRIRLADVILGKTERRHSNLFMLPSVTTTKQGKRTYMKLYMREKRQQQKRR